MKIGELAKMTHCQVVTIRYYERAGLLPPPERSEGNYRLYTAVHAERLAFIRNCRALDMTLDEVRQLLDYRDHPTQDCTGVNELVDEHIAHVTARIEILQALHRQLTELRQRCTEEHGSADCQILQQLTTSDSFPAGHAASHVGPSHRELSGGE
ncbi:Cd(II)/Pb(II)-responsive transcriptional regulator [Halopseudomonas xiamenensis]|uniref:Cd(II)/Pb(II)-responsive transcriptional regulator n=1 Tax=Halopseudomonas xiamenensis TaxID=157792 RepID=UPI001624929F|nr:Cd(II)/Pb(II)-responsive transcriptional regulator [Halopseudomonas xiamenensis]